MRILFINPWQKSLFGDEKAKPGHPHLGLAYLIAVLKQNGIDNIEVFDQGLEGDDEVLFQKIKKQNTELLAITSFSYCIEYASDLIKKIKNFDKNLPIIIGGAHVSAVKERVFEQVQADFAMYGESEKSFLLFLNQFQKEKEYETVPNLIWKSEEDRVTCNTADSYVTDLDSLPFPDYDAFEFERYSYSGVKALPIITSRGCPYGCNYCSVKLSMGRGFRPRSPESIVAEFKYWIAKYGTERFEVNDDCFSLDIERAEKICDLIIQENLNIKYEMYNGIRADRVSERLLSKMKNSGCIFVSFGCESGNQKVINNMGKALKLEKVIEAVELANKVGIRNSVNFIFGHKDETFQNAMDTLEFAERLPTSFVNFYNIIPYPGTVLYEWMKKNARQLIPDDQYLSRIGSRDGAPVFETDEFTKEQRIIAFKKGNALYEKSVLRFRFGKIFGLIMYLISRNRVFFKIGRMLALGNPVGFKIYSFFTMKSRRI